ARDGRRTARADPAGVPRRERDQGRRPGGHGRMRREDVRAVDRSAVPRRGRSRRVRDAGRASAAVRGGADRRSRGGEGAMSGAGYDVIVIGAGSIGIPTALAAARAGLATLVLDERASPGQGANKAAIGGVRATHSDGAKIRLCRRSLEVFSGWQDDHGDDIEWSTGGYAFVAYREQEEAAFRRLLDVQHGYGLDIDWLDAPALLARVPDLAKDGLRGGTLSPGDGHCSTLLASHAMYRAAQRAGATFHFGEHVTEVLVAKGAVRG